MLKHFMLQLNVSSPLPIFKVIAFPFVKESRETNDGYLNIHAPDLDDLSCWFNNIPDRIFDRIEDTNKLLASLLCERSAASFLVSVFDSIDKQSFLKQNYKKAEAGRAYSNKTDQFEITKPGKHEVLSLQFLYLTPEQTRIWNQSVRKVVIGGAPGTGKTLLIQLKALEMRKEGTAVLIILGSSELVKLYARFFTANGIELAQDPHIQLLNQRKQNWSSEAIA